MNESHDLEAEPAPPQRASALLWLLFILTVAWIIYEVTHSPAWAAMVMCLKFGWEDFHTAWWLRRTDPDRARGRACFWLYLAAGLWQTAVIGVAMVLLTVVLDFFLQAQQQAPGANQGLLGLLTGAGLTIIFGFISSAIITYIALIKAYRGGIRPWLNSAVHIARRRREWPPLYGHRNRIMVLVISTVLATCFILIPTFLGILVALGHRFARGKGEGVFFTIGLLATIFVVIPSLFVLLREMRRQGFFAKHPADCWGDEPVPIEEEPPQSMV